MSQARRSRGDSVKERPPGLLIPAEPFPEGGAVAEKSPSGHGTATAAA
jgi:hypothetical protein